MDFESTEAYMKLRSIGLQQRIRERLRTVKSKGIAERREMRNFLETIKSMQEAAQTRRSALPVYNRNNVFANYGTITEQQWVGSAGNANKLGFP